MSKNKLYGNEKWYEVNLTPPKKKGFPIPVRLERKFEKDGYKIFLESKFDEEEYKKILNDENIKNNQINDETVVGKFREHQEREVSLERANKIKKFSEFNIFFKLKFIGNKKCLDLKRYENQIEVTKKSENLKKFNKSLSRANIEEKINQEYKSTTKLPPEINISNKKIILIDADNSDRSEFKEINKKKYAVEYRILDKTKIENKIFLIENGYAINKKIYELYEQILKENNYDNRFYKEKIVENLSDNEIITEIVDILKKINEQKIGASLKESLDFYIPTNQKATDNKRIFKEKIINYLCYNGKEIIAEDIIQFIVKELEEYRLIKRVKPIGENYTNENDIQRYVKTDRHVIYNQVKIEEKKQAIKISLLKMIEHDSLEEMFNEIYKKFEVEELAKKVKRHYDSASDNTETTDTVVFKIFKDHYKETIKEKISCENNEHHMNEIYKQIYKYLHGRINKCVEKRKFIDFGIDKKKYKKTQEKTLTSLKQSILEYILYIGRLGYLEIEKPDTNKMQVEHYKEELNLEIIAFLTHASAKISEFTDNPLSFNEETKKYTEIVINEDGHHVKLLEELEFITTESGNYKLNNNFVNFMDGSLKKLRNGLIHNVLKEKREKLAEEEKLNKRIEKLLSELKPSDEEISKSINLSVFYYNNVIIDTINNLKMGSGELAKYFPGFNKLVPRIKKQILEDSTMENYDEEIREALINCAIYVNKQLYKKLISNEESSFLKYLTEKNKGKPNYSFENEYKKAQKNSAKGNGKAVRLLQNYIIDEYFYFINEDGNYKMALDFSNFYNCFDSKDKVEAGYLKEPEQTLKTENPEVKIAYNYEYALIVMALFSDNIYLNKIIGRLKSTTIGISSFKEIDTKHLFDYNKMIEILEHIKDIKNEKNIILNAEIPKTIENYQKIRSKYELYFDEKNEERFKKIKDERLNSGAEIEIIAFNFLEKEIENINKSFTELEIGPVTLEQLKESYKIHNGFNFKTFLIKTYSEINNVERTKIGEIQTKSSEFEKSFDEYYKNETEKLNRLENLAASQYTNTLKRLSEPNYENYIDIYIQKDGTDYKTIFRKKLFKAINLTNFKILSENFNLPIENSVSEYKKAQGNKIKEKIKSTNEFLNELKRIVKDNGYKRVLLEEVKTDGSLFNKYFPNVNYETFEEFEDDYDDVRAYNHHLAIIEFEPIIQLHDYLVDINYKILLQLERFERDIHYLVVGLKKLGIIDYNISASTDSTLAILKNKDGYYKFDETNRKVFNELAKFFGLKADTFEVRNYFAHFDIFKKPIIKDGQNKLVKNIFGVQKLLEYRTKYNNSTWNAVLQVFGKDYEINYDYLKKGINENEYDVEKLISNKKITPLKLESNKSLDIVYQILRKEK